MDYLEIKGEQHPFWFSIRAYREMGKANMAEKDDLYLIWLGLKFGARIEKSKFTLTEEDLVDAFELDLDGYSTAYNLLNEHLGKLKVARGMEIQKE